MFMWLTALRHCTAWFEPAEESSTPGSLFRLPRMREGNCRVNATVKGDPWPATVRTLSTNQIAILVSRAPIPGSRLVATLQHSTRRIRRDVRINVESVNEHSSGNWMVNGSFGPALSASELQGLMN